MGVVRVSRVGGRSGENFVSPSEQAERIAAACERDGVHLVETLEELDVSGGAPLTRRHGLRRAVEMVEAREADVLVVAYFDRLVRSLKVQLEVAERVEKAGGTILALDLGTVGVGATGKLTAQFLGAVAEYHRNVTAERTMEAKRRAIARGVPTFNNIPPGYRKRADGTLEPDPKTAAVVADAFKLRADGATVMEVREHLRAHGVERSFHGVQSLLHSRVVLGELHFGDLHNTASHPAIVDPTTWKRVQRMSSPRGRRAKSERLLARLGVLRCGTCGARMVVGSTRQTSGDYAFYRCNPTSDCPQRVTVSAELAESVVVEAVKQRLTGMRGTANDSDGAEEALRELDRAERALDAAFAAFTGNEDVPAAQAKLTELRETRDKAQARVDDLQAAATARTVVVSADDWDRLSAEGQRDIIRVVVERADVAPGRGRDRISVQLFE